MLHEQAALWFEANRRLVAKAIAEMTFEEMLQPAAEGDSWLLVLQSGVHYRFQAWRTVWSLLRIDAGSLQRQDKQGAWESVTAAGQFFIDAQLESGMDAIVLGNFLEEMHRTLYADMKLLQRQRHLPAASWIKLDGERLQGLLDGHPKVLLNKGRVGWGSPDLGRFAPESQPQFQLFWLAVARQASQRAFHPNWNWTRLLDESMQADEQQRFVESARSLGADPERYDYMPLHPWQWEQVIEQQFAGAIAQGQLIPLGSFGDRYRPQTSLRTLSNADRPERLQIKLALSILNTSCVRGLPAHYLAIAPDLSLWLSTICQSDPLLAKAGTRVLQDVASLHVAHENYAQVANAPYRYHEYLGVVWRESAQSGLRDGEQAIITGSLLQKDAAGESLLNAWIQASGMGPDAWLRAYFSVVVVPLYHLQCKYGVGLVAHGQNIILRLDHGRPIGMSIKDLQGDLRIVDEDLPELRTLPPFIKAKLTRLPAQHLIHDLQTGHFVTVLRYMSAVLQETAAYPESSFYRILAAVLQDYEQQQPALVPRLRSRSLLERSMPRIVINKVRFAVGYADHAQRPLPMLGSDLPNPLHVSWEGERHVSLSL